MVYWNVTTQQYCFSNSPFIPRDDSNKLKSGSESEQIWMLTSSFCYFPTFVLTALKTARILAFLTESLRFLPCRHHFESAVWSLRPEAFWNQQFTLVKMPYAFMLKRKLGNGSLCHWGSLRHFSGQWVGMGNLSVFRLLWVKTSKKSFQGSKSGGQKRGKRAECQNISFFYFLFVKVN